MLGVPGARITAWRVSGAVMAQLRKIAVPAARVGWVIFAAGVAALPVAGIPITFDHLRSPCPDTTLCPDTGQLSLEGLRALQTAGWSLDMYALATVLVLAGSALVWIAVAGLVVWQRPRDPMALLAGWFLLAGSVAVANGPLRDAAAGAHPGWAVVAAVARVVAPITLGLFVALFPDGRWVPGWAGWLPLGWTAFLVPDVIVPGSLVDGGTWPAELLLPVLFGLAGASVYAQLWRYRHASVQVQRQQIKWVVAGLSAALSGWFAVVALGYVAFPELLRPGSPWQLVFGALFRGTLLLIPLSIGAAVLRAGLWDIQPIVNRTLVYGALTAAIAALYVAIVGYLSLLLHGSDNPLVGLIATGIVAVVVQPLRARLQRGVNRVLYGRRDEPYLVLSRLGQRLENVLAPEAVLDTIVQTVAEALRLPYVAIVLGADASMQVAAAHGTPVPSVDRWPLVYQAETVGELLVAPRAPGEAFGVSDRGLLEDLARQAGVSAFAVRLTRDLQRLAFELQQARERLVAAREEERRRLRNELHDGVGPTLASLVQRLDAASRVVQRDPQAAIKLMADLKLQVRATVADIRQLVYALRPPALDELGLVSAIREHAAQHLEPVGLGVTVEAPTPFPPLPAAVEVAAYRIALEALTNVARHANARTCSIRLDPTHDLLIEVVDDGRGICTTAPTGVGLTSMRERAAELGGACTIELGIHGGTLVRARLPRLIQQQS